jgi:hypothetical protein
VLSVQGVSNSPLKWDADGNPFEGIDSVPGLSASMKDAFKRGMAGVAPRHVVVYIIPGMVFGILMYFWSSISFLAGVATPAGLLFYGSSLLSTMFSLSTTGVLLFRLGHAPIRVRHNDAVVL